MAFQFLCLKGWKVSQITKNNLRTMCTNMHRQRQYDFCETNSLTLEKTMQSIPMHSERQIYLATVLEQKLLNGGVF